MAPAIEPLQKAVTIGSASMSLTNSESGTTSKTPSVVTIRPLRCSFMVSNARSRYEPGQLTESVH